MSNTNTSLDVHSLDFWEKVKSEYNVGNGKYICGSSEIFKLAWETYYSINDTNWRSIRKLAFVFKKENKYKTLMIGVSFLFIGDGCGSFRVEFIDWCIERFKNAKLQDNTGTNGVNPSPPPNFSENNADTGN